MSRRSVPWVVGIAALLLVACGCSALLVSATLPGALGAWGLGGAVAIIEVDGAITYGEAPGGLVPGGVALSRQVISEVEAAEADPRVRAIVLDVNSPGGSVVASAEIHRALQEASKPVVTSMGETAASGGYYIACATDAIYARPATITGSIGVRWEIANVEELTRKLGIEIISITSGELKDLGSPYSPLSEEERAIFQALVDESYDAFVRVVAEGRNLPEEQVRTLADGRVFSGLQALELGLVDSLGGLDEAVAHAAELGGIRGEPRIVRYRRPAGLWDVLSTFSTSRTSDLAVLRQVLAEHATPRLQYLYVGP